MSDEIKVWVAVEPESSHPMTSGIGATENHAWERIAKALSPSGQVVTANDRHRISYFKSKGWTVEPYTLTKGHAP